MDAALTGVYNFQVREDRQHEINVFNYIKIT